MADTAMPSAVQMTLNTSMKILKRRKLRHCDRQHERHPLPIELYLGWVPFRRSRKHLCLLSARAHQSVYPQIRLGCLAIRPNITGRTDGYNNFITATGAFEVLNNAVSDIPSSTSTGYHGFGFDASKCSSIYTTSGKLQPKALNCLPCIRC